LHRWSTSYSCSCSSSWPAPVRRSSKKSSISAFPAAPPIIIDISPDGQVVANNQSFGTPTDKSLLTLRDWLKATQGFGGEDPVIIRPNAETRHERIIDVLNACAAAGIKNLTFS
jgi:biopolymer transport protein ExbD